MTEATVPIVHLPDALDLLAQWMTKQKLAKEAIDAIEEEAAIKAAPLVTELDDATYEVKHLRRQIDETMTALGIRTTENNTIQIQRPKTSKLTIVNLDTACAHLADLNRLSEVQRVVIDEKQVIWIAETRDGGLDGVEEVTTYGFKVVPIKAKKS